MGDVDWLRKIGCTSSWLCGINLISFLLSATIGEGTASAISVPAYIEVSPQSSLLRLISSTIIPRLR